MVLFFSVTTTVLSAQDDAPKNVQTNFDKMFANAENVAWDSYEGEYIASFYTDDYVTEATFLENGNWILTSTYLEMEHLPKITQNFLSEKYDEDLTYFPGILKTVSPKGTHYVVTVETEIDSETEEVETLTLTFDEEGKLLVKQ